MRSRAEISHAHDTLVGIVNGDLPLEMSHDARVAVRAAADILCWVLHHDENENFAANLAEIQSAAREMGYEFEDHVVQ